MTSKSKKDKIKQGNLKDFDLLYDVLVNGGTYSDYRSELLDRSMPQEQLNFDISLDDILAAWILGKDEESELYARGGHIHQDQPWMLNPNNKGIGQLQKDLNQNSFTSGTAESDYTPTGLYSSDSGHNYTAGIPYVQQFDSLGGLGFNVAANANGASNDPYAKFIMGDTSGGFLQLMMSQKSSLREGANYIKSLELNFGVGDNAYLAQQYNQMQPIARSTMDADAVDTWKWIFDPSGIMHSWGLIDYDASEGLDYLNSIAEQVENRNKQNFNTAVTNSNKLNLWNQLSQPYMAACGGKMKNKLASGGYINSHYDYITDPLVKVDAGGTHQENPNEGVLTSIAPDGQPNLVEEGETIINNQDDAYVFSDRIVADDEILKSHLLPNKFAGKTYADISKELDKIIEEHKNDEISKRTFDEMISRLQQAQEDQKFQEKQEEVEKFLDGLTDEQKEQLEQTMVEEAQTEQQVAEEQAVAEQQAKELAALEQQMQPEQAPEQVVMEQPEEQIVPSRYDQMMSRALFADAADLGMFQLGGHLNLKSGYMPFYNPNLGTASYKGVPYIDPLFASDIAPYTESYYNKTPIEEIVVERPTYIKPRQTSKTTTVVTTPNVKVEQTPEYSNPHMPNYKIFGEYVPGLKPYDVDGNLLGYTDLFGKFVPIGGETSLNTPVGVTSSSNGANTTTVDTDEPVKGSKTGSTRDYSTWLRYAPAVGSGIQYLSDLFGVTNRNDFSNADMYQRSIKAIPDVGFTPLGNYMTYSPLDETYQQNVARSQYNAARRAIQNNASGNASAALAAMDSLNGNMNNTFGDLALQAREYNDKQREAVEQFNANIARINSMMSLSTQEKNQAIAAEKARLTYNLANMRENIQNMNDTAKSANENAFYSNLGAIGKENFNMQMVRTNPAFYYTIMDDGSIVYKNGFYDLNKGDLDLITADAEKAQKEQLKKNSEYALKKSKESKDKEEPIWFNRYYGRNYLNPYIGNSYLMPLNFNTRIGG